MWEAEDQFGGRGFGLEPQEIVFEATGFSDWCFRVTAALGPRKPHLLSGLGFPV